MSTTRRSFLIKSALATAGLVWSGHTSSAAVREKYAFPVVLSTWSHGFPANEAAWEVLSAGGYALDAVEKGVRVPEGDPEVHSVGIGGAPDASGKVTLDACIMNEKGDTGGVAFLQHIQHPISVARLVMEETPHVMLCGRGAQKFALDNGFTKEKLLTRKMRKRWRSWIKNGKGYRYHPGVNAEKQPAENHDTIGMLAIDRAGRLCGACSTSGLAYKMPGRVGDSPIIGAGLFVDGEVGGAAATGTGELVMKTLGTFLIVELMRNGLSPNEACREAISRITEKIPAYREHQIGYIALNKYGEPGSASLKPGFEYALKTNRFSGLKEADSWLKKL